VPETGSYPAQRLAGAERQPRRLDATPVPVAASDLLRRHDAEWRAATCHPFLDGVLPVGAFIAWLQQDYLFVNDLLAFQARLLARAPRSGQSVLAAGLVALEAELTWFEEQLTRRGLPLVTARHPITDAYREELERLTTEPAEVGISALWALELAYMEAWRGAAPGASEYREFVEHWTAPAFAHYVAGLEVHATDSPAAEAAWLRIVRLEREFWDMAVTFSASGAEGGDMSSPS
jgi:formylaminopyrimidine deformylase / aminopyrimidine aminohydrolase